MFEKQKTYADREPLSVGITRLLSSGASPAVAGNRSEALLRAAFFDNLPDPVLLCDREMMVLAANRAAAELLGEPPGELVNRNAKTLLPGSAHTSRPVVTEEPLTWRSATESSREPQMLEVSGLFLNDPALAAQGWILTLREVGAGRDIPNFVGNSPLVQELLAFVARIAPSGASSILLLGESGTGKELIAKRLHALSGRFRGAFVPVNCAALPAALLESELFGHEKGAFTGAGDAREGLMESAAGGTLFLDEIGELPLPLQAKLLRALDDHSFRRVGGTRNISVDVRIIGATNVNLERAIEERRFRSDLYYRLNGVQIQVPPLRERREDIAELVQHFLTHFNQLHKRSLRGIHPAALHILSLYSWPGNIRELRNIIERAVLVEPSPLLTPESLALPKRNGSGSGSAIPGAKSPEAALSLRSTEKELIAVALEEAKGNQSRAAALLGIGRFSLRYKMKKLGLL